MFEKFTESGLIEPEELYELQKNETANLIILDASFALPSSGIHPHEKFQQNHIENALYFDIDAIADKNTDLPHILPPPDEFSKAMDNFGITNESFVIVYGQDGIVMGAARAWWMFKAMGHDNVAILNGGLPAWIKSDYRTTAELTSVKSHLAPYKAKPQPLVCTMKDVHKHSSEQSALILDARPADRFHGKQGEPRQGLQKGHIPHSKNIPASSLIDPVTLKLKNKNELNKIFIVHKTTPQDVIIATCGSGVTACIISFALYHTGIKDTLIYDGSWAEWGQIQLKNPIAQYS